MYLNTSFVKEMLPCLIFFVKTCTFYGFVFDFDTRREANNFQVKDKCKSNLGSEFKVMGMVQKERNLVLIYEHKPTPFFVCEQLFQRQNQKRFLHRNEL